MSNYYAAPGFSRAPPGYGVPPAGMGPPPGMGPPGMALPTAPGVPQVNFQQPPVLGGPRPLPHAWHPPANMPNINMNAPVIRLGTHQPSRGGASERDASRRDGGAPSGRRGLGMDGNMRDSDMGGRNAPSLVPLTAEELARTIFVGNIPEGAGGDEGLERIMAAAGNLRRWTRVVDANNKPQTFGFAEYEDAQSLETAAALFTDVQVPTKRQTPREVKPEEGEEVKEVEKTKLQVMVDDASIKYAEKWSRTRKEDEAVVQFRLDSAKESLAQVLASLFNPPNMPQVDHSGDAVMHDVPMEVNEGIEVAVIPLSAAEDELADIPAEMRDIVATEIKAFRDRSIQRDRERLRKEEEMEAEDRRSRRRVSPPPSAPTGPGGVNGVPLGPRADRGIQGAPSGPKASQLPRDYQNGVNFVNGGAINGGVTINHEDDDDPASDSEIEQRRKDKRAAESDNLYKKKLADWIKHETRTTSSLERTNDQRKKKMSELEAAREAQANQLKSYDDDVEASQGRHIYYRDYDVYKRDRERVRDIEKEKDNRDRDQEERELASQRKQKEDLRNQADAFLEQQAEELLLAVTPQEPQQIKISFGAAAKKIEQQTAPRRTAADVENLLEDEEITEQPGAKKRTLIPINYDASARPNLTPQEIADVSKQVVKGIPQDKDGLWNWPVSWKHLLKKHIDKDLKDWAAKKVLDYLGIQEDMVVDAIVDHLRSRGGPQELVEELEMALEEESESFVKKLWRMVIYYSEMEKQGIN
ncbi:hypothetical protein BDV95DRAFT_559217 [Massariosphaeria phaeospora]|uniref:PWI domain-containing protein n=1 Tax=Massariosphaeria phaeospora TaxID=100035 RepID=A0A7C8MI44_9PLEO|nr:hypothetical protein BDV95DRAFT_559217 [Massariosphaeria phaeospora]